MEKSFARLLRNSRLASFDPTLNQVYTTPKQCKKTGNWGLKRGLPTVIRTPHVTIGALDTAEHQTPWQSGESQVLFVKRWKENFPNSRRPAPRSEVVEHNVAQMTPAEFKHFLKRVSERSPEFRQKLENKELKPEQVYEFLGVTFNETRASGVVGPTYSDYEFGWNYPVQGRFLNTDRQGHTVGIGGVVALAPKRHAADIRFGGDRRQRTFYVESAEIDAQGRPQVLVKPLPPGASSMSSILGRGDMAADDMWAPRKPIRPKNEDNDKPENVQPNPQHTLIMERISGILNRSKSDD